VTRAGAALVTLSVGLFAVALWAGTVPTPMPVWRAVLLLAALGLGWALWCAGVTFLALAFVRWWQERRAWRR